MRCPYKPNVRVVVHIVYHYSQKGSEMRVVVQIKDHHSHSEGVFGSQTVVYRYQSQGFVE